jgi:hypothetical protein
MFRRSERVLHQCGNEFFPLVVAGRNIRRREVDRTASPARDSAEDIHRILSVTGRPFCPHIQFLPVIVSALHLPCLRGRIPKLQLRDVGWTKAVELVRLVRKNGTEFDCATWVHRAKELPKEEFRREVERHLTGKEIEPWEIIYFKLYKSQLPVVEKAIETVALMLLTDKSRGYCLEMICADSLDLLPTSARLRTGE